MADIRFTPGQPIRPPSSQSTAAPHQAHPAHAHPAPAHPAPATKPGIAPMPVQPLPDEHLLDPIDLVDEAAGAEASKKIRAFGPSTQQKQHDWKRKAAVNGSGAIRVRTFHGKLSDQGMGFLDEQINEWLDNHPEVEVKFVTSSVGVFEGKIREPALVLNLWY